MSEKKRAREETDAYEEIRASPAEFRLIANTVKRALESREKALSFLACPEAMELGLWSPPSRDPYGGAISDYVFALSHGIHAGQAWMIFERMVKEIQQRLNEAIGRIEKNAEDDLRYAEGIYEAYYTNPKYDGLENYFNALPLVKRIARMYKAVMANIKRVREAIKPSTEEAYKKVRKLKLAWDRNQITTRNKQWIWDAMGWVR